MTEDGLLTLDEASAKGASSDSGLMTIDEANKVYRTQRPVTFKEDVPLGARVGVRLQQDYVEPMEKIPANTMIWMGNALTRGSHRSEVERNIGKGLYEKPDDIRYSIGSRLMNLGMANLSAIENRQKQDRVDISGEGIDVIPELAVGAMSLAQSIVLGTVAGPLAAAGAFGLQTLSSETEKVMESDVKDKGDVLLKAPLFDAIVQGGVEAVSLSRFLKETGRFVPRIMKRTINEIVQEDIQFAGEAGIEFGYGIRKPEEAKDLPLEFAWNNAMAAILGGAGSVSFGIAERNAMIDHYTEVTGDRKKAKKVADKILEATLDDFTSYLETDAQLKQGYGEIRDVLYTNIYDMVEKSGALSSMSEDERASFVRAQADKFAKELAVESIYQRKPINEILETADISVNDSGNLIISMKMTGREGQQTLMQDTPLHLEAKKAIEQGMSKEEWVKSNVVEDVISKESGLKVVNKKSPSNSDEVDLGTRLDFSDGNTTVETYINETSEQIILTGIHARPVDGTSKTAKGTGKGTSVINALKKYADLTGKQLVVPSVTKPAASYWNKVKFLNESMVEVPFEGKMQVVGQTFEYTPKSSDISRIYDEAKGNRLMQSEAKQIIRLTHNNTMASLGVDDKGQPLEGSRFTVVSSSGTFGQGKGQTGFENFRQDSLQYLKDFAEKHDLNFIITAATEDSGHDANRPVSHKDGQKVDFRSIVNHPKNSKKQSQDVAKYNALIESFGATESRINKEGKTEVGYKDPDSGTVFWKEGNHWDVEIVPSQTLMQKERASVNIQAKKDRVEYLVSLTKNADASSISHEFAHVHLDNMMRFVKSGKASEGYMKRWGNVAKFLGISDGQDVITTEQQEKFARGYEAYLYTGEAPSPELINEFNAYRKWMRDTYSDIKELNVELTPEATKFFDSMMTIDKNYITNRTTYGTRKRPNRLGRDISGFISNVFVPLSTRLDKVDRSLRTVLRRHIFDINMANKKDIDAVRPFIQNMEKLSDNDWKDLDLALKNGDRPMAMEIATRNGIQADLQNVLAVIDDIYAKAKSAGIDVGYIENYFPRRVQDVDEYLEFLRGGDQWSAIRREIRNEERKLERPLTEEEKAHVADHTIRGYGGEKINAGRPSNVKERKIVSLSAEQNAFYKDSPTALLEYISSMNEKIEAYKFLGQGKNIDESIGAVVNKLIDDGVITNKQEKEVANVFKAYFGKRGTSGLVSLYKNASYIYTMGSPLSAITQIGDLAFSFYKNGYYNTLKNVVNSKGLTKQSVGIDNIIEEFSDSTKSAKAVSSVFKAIGLDAMDAMGKQTFINAAFDRLSTLAKKNKLNLDKIIAPENIPQVLKDLKNKVASDDVKFLLFSELSDFQPLSLAEMPESYVKGGNARLWYMLKSYTLKQFDAYHNEVFRQATLGKGIGNLLRLTFALMLMGMTADGLKDVLLGRPIKMDDLVLDNILKAAGFSKYTIYKAKREGAATAAMQIVNPPVPFFDDIFKDMGKLFDEKDDNAKDLRIWNSLPLVGKFYYWWFGGGRKYLEENGG